MITEDEKLYLRNILITENSSNEDEQQIIDGKVRFVYCRAGYRKNKRAERHAKAHPRMKSGRTKP